MTQEEKGKTYALHKASEKLHDYYGSAMLNVVQFDGHDIQCAYVDGCLQTKQDLKVEEVDLDEEFDKYCETLYLIDLENEPYAELFECAKHFFELGLKTQKGE